MRPLPYAGSITEARKARDRKALIELFSLQRAGDPNPNPNTDPHPNPNPNLAPVRKALIELFSLQRAGDPNP